MFICFFAGMLRWFGNFGEIQYSMVYKAWIWLTSNQIHFSCDFGKNHSLSSHLKKLIEFEYF